ncbi:AraC family transcriptional regulator [Anaerobacillus sp. 1_MG-2023]|uniref:helix-turn-helix transcriptional regulator n=1 Tax=Bacillales TaxID=1385 RepID=UPI0026E22E06|nr:AraC family transcriptional regulator [Anaerobacillus sp. 1_MG-2023]MDO6654710.1 AraC family transcriptional regulator [Anaerobacillus sp. 1_MG-2023]
MDELTQAVCEKRIYTEEANTHEHMYGQFLFPLKGLLSMETDNGMLELDGNHAFYLAPSRRHTFSSSSHNECLTLDIPSHYFSGSLTSLEEQYIDLNEQWKSIRYLLLEEAYQDRSSAALTQLVRFIGTKLKKNRYASVQYIHDHFASKVDLELLAKIEHYHPSYYSAWFKKVTGKKVSTYIHHVRLEESKRLLLETSWSITNISQEVGYEYPSSFTRLFVQYTGCSPQHYRKIMKLDKKELHS